MIPRDIDSLCSLRELEYLQTVCSEKDVLEIGSYLGGSTIAIAQVAHSVIAVDWHRGGDTLGPRDTLGEFWNNIRRYGVADNVMVVIGTSSGVLPRLNSRVADIAFIDACHSGRQPYLDMVNSWHCLGTRPELLVHDYHESWPAVVSAVGEMRKKFHMEVVDKVDTLIHLRADER